MIPTRAVSALFMDLDETELHAWIARGWVRPEASGSDWLFHDIDIARVRLIHDLSRRLEVAEETLPLVLSLLDQVYDLREQMQALLRAVGRQPEPVRRAILAAL